MQQGLQKSFRDIRFEKKLTKTEDGGEESEKADQYWRWWWRKRKSSPRLKIVVKRVKNLTKTKDSDEES